MTSSAAVVLPWTAVLQDRDSSTLSQDAPLGLILGIR